MVMASNMSGLVFSITVNASALSAVSASAKAGNSGMTVLGAFTATETSEIPVVVGVAPM